MGRIFVGDIQGPPGDVGPVGPPGSGGANSLFDGSAYNIQSGANNFVGDQDPVITEGSVPNGSIWFDATGIDTTGGSDVSNLIQDRLDTGLCVLGPGSFLINDPAALAFNLPGTTLKGSGSNQTKIIVGPSFSASELFSINADSCEISGIGIIGSSSTITSNPYCNAIQMNGQPHCRFTDLTYKYINGWCFEGLVGPSQNSVDLILEKIVGRNCAAGIHVKGNSGTSYLGEHQFSNVSFQQMGVTSGPAANLDAVLIEDISDIIVSGINIGAAATAPGSAIKVLGACSAIYIACPDVGANAMAGGSPSLYVLSGANGSPTDVSVVGGTLGYGVCSAQVDAGNDIRFTSCRFHQAYSSGLVVNGGNVILDNCAFAANNQSGGTGYDVDTSGSSSGNSYFRNCVLETPKATSTPGSVTNPVSTSTHSYFTNCSFIGSGVTPSGVFSGTPQVVRDCNGYNPRGSVTAPTVGTSPYTPSTYQADLRVVFTAVNGMTNFAIAGISLGAVPPIGIPFHIKARESMTITWSGTAPTWIWLSE